MTIHWGKPSSSIEMTTLSSRIWRLFLGATGLDQAHRSRRLDARHAHLAPQASAAIAKERLLLTLDRHGPDCSRMTPQATQELIADVLAAINKHTRNHNPIRPTVNIEQTPYSLSIRMETQ